MRPGCRPDPLPWRCGPAPRWCPSVSGTRATIPTTGWSSASTTRFHPRPVHPGPRRRARHGHRRAPARLAHDAAAVHRRPATGRSATHCVWRVRPVKVGMVCPYSWDMPGGVQVHIRDLAEELMRRGHSVSVLAAADDDTPVPPYVISAGRAVPIHYNGSVARLTFGPLSASRVRRWLADGRFY